MLSKAQIKHIRALQRNKYRRQHQQYVAEGDKMVRELIEEKVNIIQIVATAEWLAEYRTLIKGSHIVLAEVSETELKQISSLTTPNKALCVVKMPDNALPDTLNSDGLYLALDGIQDPGNMGTIIRTADWFGVDGIVCSPTCVDIYNSKVVQATMSSIARVPVFVAELPELLNDTTLQSYAADMDGESIEKADLNKGIIVIGNEGNGISNEVATAVSQKVTIPRYGSSESLNAGIATGILLAWARLKK